MKKILGLVLAVATVIALLSPIAVQAQGIGVPSVVWSSANLAGKAFTNSTTLLAVTNAYWQTPAPTATAAGRLNMALHLSVVDATADHASNVVCYLWKSLDNTNWVAFDTASVTLAANGTTRANYVTNFTVGGYPYFKASFTTAAIPTGPVTNSWLRVNFR